MVYLVGVDHSVQWNRALHLTAEFADYLEAEAEDLRIELIAEEFSDEYVRAHKVGSSVTQDLAAKLGIEHRFCEVNIGERMGWDDPKDVNRREAHWLERIRDSSDKETFFVCGSSHLSSFRSLLENSGFSVRVLPRRFDVIEE